MKFFVISAYIECIGVDNRGGKAQRGRLMVGGCHDLSQGAENSTLTT
jgi:hypothetical protein